MSRVGAPQRKRIRNKERRGRMVQKKGIWGLWGRRWLGESWHLVVSDFPREIWWNEMVGFITGLESHRKETITGSSSRPQESNQNNGDIRGGRSDQDESNPVADLVKERVWAEEAKDSVGTPVEECIADLLRVFLKEPTWRTSWSWSRIIPGWKMQNGCRHQWWARNSMHVKGP